MPSRESFYNDLTKEHISEENYQFCQTIWKEFEMKKFEHYHLLYNLIDVLILTDILNRQSIYLSQKSFYPYEWLNDQQKLHFETLPSRESFFNDLTEENISEENYQFCQTIWDEFEMTKFEHYHLLYNLIDVLILTDILLFFRKLMRHDFNLDSLKFFSMPGLALKAALKYSGQQIQLLTDMDQHLFGNSCFSFIILQ